ncbi:patatin-like phospholipase family protein [Methylocystis silviterrae]|uniref:patatin-like phospholipase family protein n=1 Tax=Methylocystis silviterrae TaxID=2743612 RepID=UPI00158185FB
MKVRGRRERLLDEVDVISAVSGGSYTAAYYGLFRDRLFTDFESAFLKRDIEQDLVSLLLNPVTATTLASPQFNRSDLAAKWLGENIFAKSTFADLNAKGRPFVVINASDINTGMTFSFVQQQFDFLCSSIDNYPVANAVLASSAVPGVFAPIAVRNYDVDCAERRNSWIGGALKTGNIFSREYQVALALERYSDPRRMPVVRLVDGGVTDNLGVRGSMMSPVLHFGNVADMAGVFDQHRLDNVARVLVVVANAQAYGEYDWSKQGLEPGLIDNVQASFETSIGVINSETVSLAMRGFRQWADHVSARPSRTGKPPVDLQFAVLTFDNIRDAAQRRAFNDVPTSFALEAQQVDFVRSMGKRLLFESPEFKTFVARSH